jgi:aspartate aminotransferase
VFSFHNGYGGAIMPEISNTAKALPASGIRKFVPFADMAKKRGIQVYQLNIGQPDLPSVEGFGRAIKAHKFAENPIEAFPKDVVAYAKSGGMDSQRKAMSDYYCEHDIFVDPSEIIVTTGGSEALQFAFTIVGDPGDQVIVPEPFFSPYQTHAMRAGVQLIPFKTEIGDNFALKNLEQGIEDILAHNNRVKAILINSPNNPTGAVYSLQEMFAIANVARKHDLFVMSDEVYREICFDGKEHTSILHQDRIGDLSDKAILLDSLSKRYSLCGARIGMLVSKNRRVIDSAMKIAQSRLSVATLEQIGCEEAMNDFAYVEFAREAYGARRDIAFDVLSQDRGITVARPAGAFYMIIDIGKGIKGEHLCAEEFTWYMLEKFDVDKKTTMVTPANGFYLSHGAGFSEIRLAFVIGEKKLQDACKILLKGIESFKEWKQQNPADGYIRACDNYGILR